MVQTRAKRSRSPARTKGDVHIDDHHDADRPPKQSIVHPKPGKTDTTHGKTLHNDGKHDADVNESVDEVIDRGGDRGDDGDVVADAAIIRTRALPRDVPCATSFEAAVIAPSRVADAVFAPANGPAAGFLVVVTDNGHVQFWRRTRVAAAFVRQYRAHVDSVSTSCISADGALFATAGKDCTAKVFDVAQFDMIRIVTLPFQPLTIAFIGARRGAPAWLAVSDRLSGRIAVFDVRGDVEPVAVLDGLHRLPVAAIAAHPTRDVVVSCDVGGTLEYWDLSSVLTGKIVLPNVPRDVSFSSKTETDLFIFLKTRAPPTSIVFSRTGSRFAAHSPVNATLRVFDFKTGRLLCTVNGSTGAAADRRRIALDSGASIVDAMEFDRRCAVERDLCATSAAQLQEIADYTSKKDVKWKVSTVGQPLRRQRAVFDDNDSIVFVSTLEGVIAADATTGDVIQVLGGSESERFLSVSLFQGTPLDGNGNVGGSDVAAMLANPTLAAQQTPDPTLACIALRKERVFLFTRREPEDGVFDIAAP